MIIEGEKKQPVSRIKSHKDYCVIPPSHDKYHKENLENCDTYLERKVNEVDPRNNTHQVIGSDLPFIFHHTRKNEKARKFSQSNKSPTHLMMTDQQETKKNLISMSSRKEDGKEKKYTIIGQ